MFITVTKTGMQVKLFNLEKVIQMCVLQQFGRRLLFDFARPDIIDKVGRNNC